MFVCLSVCLTAEMSRTRAPRKTGFFAATFWPNLNNRKKIKFFRGQEGPENSEIRV